MKLSTEPLGAWPAVASSQALQSRIKAAKVLMVGAGGIGCELLKTLVLTGFRNIELVDLDTIDTSNLNRQFLFRKRHVGQSKAQVAAEAVKRFRPAANITAHQGNINDAQFDVDFFRGFDIVLNGLDNLEARRHVNRLCLAAETVLIESGTTGYIGQASVHLKGRTECFECRGKSAPKTYPVCTIRNTPDKPIHCVVWAKDLLFQRLFGRSDEVTDLDEEGEDATAGAEEAGPSTSGDASFFLRQDGEPAGAYARRIFDRVFNFDIQRVLRMDELWKTRSPPTPLQLPDRLLDNKPSTPAAAPIANGSAGSGSGQHSAAEALGLQDSHRLWSLEENAQVFLECIRQYVELRPGDIGAAVFDKDDPLGVEFVASAANLRSLAYGIPPQSLFDAKGMAGNIIHAIATTNATVSGLMVVEALKLLSGAHAHLKGTFIASGVSGSKVNRLLLVEAPQAPNPQCVVCGTAQLQLRLNTSTTRLSELIDKVLKRQLAVNSPTIVCGGFMYEEGEDLDPDEVAFNGRNLPVVLADLPGGGVRNGAIVTVSDQSQQLALSLVIAHQEEFDEEEHPEGFIMVGAAPAAIIENGTDTAEAGPSTAADDSDDDLMIVEEKGAAAAADPRGKRKRTAEDDAADATGHAAKAARTGDRPTGLPDDVIVL